MSAVLLTSPQRTAAPTGERLAAIWREVLELDSLPIDADEDFFALGGDSLAAVAVAVRVRDRFGVSLTIAQVFAAPTLAELARVLDGAPRTEAASRAEVPPDVLPSQARLWFLDRLIPDPQAYNVYRLVELAGLPDPVSLREALEHLCARHPALRTSFDDVDGRPRTRIHDSVAVPLTITDLSADDADVLELAGIEAAMPFDLSRAPLWRATLWIVDSRKCLLGIVCHHIVTDGWSMGLWFRELSAFYADAEAARLPLRTQPNAPFASEVPTSEDSAGQLAWWKEALSGMPAPLQLPFEKPRPRMQSFRGDVVRFDLDDSLTHRIDAFARERSATRYQVALSAFYATLYRTSGADDIVVGTPVAGRDTAASESRIGFFVRTLVLRTRIDGEAGFADLLDRVRTTTLGAFSHSSVPLEALIEALQPPRDTSRQPLFQTMFLYQSYAGLPATLGDIPMSVVPLHNGTAMFDLRLVLEDRADGGLAAWIEYNTDLFEREYIDDFAGHFVTLLNNGLDRADEPVSRLPMLLADERTRIVEDWNRTRAPWPDRVCIHQLFETHAARQPEAIAVVAGGQEYTFAELNEYANQIAHELIARDLIPGTFVGVCLPRSFDLIAAVIAVVKAGGAYVPLDPACPPARLASMIDDTRMPLILTHRDIAAKLPAGDYDALHLDRMARDLARQPGGNPPPSAKPTDRAYAIYTSGSTGQPKGVVMAHGAVVNTLDWVNRTRAVRPGDRVLFVTSICFDLSVWDIFGVLGGGGTVRVASEAELRDPAKLLKIVRTEPITLWDSAPAVLAQLVPFLGLTSPHDRNDRLRLVMLSGDWIPLTLPDAVRAVFPFAEVLSLGGATEAAIWSNSFDVGIVQAKWKSIPYGRPIRNCRYHILDSQQQPLPAGVPGELHIGGVCLAQGYHNRPALTAERFIDDPLTQRPERLYRTGDLARYWPDGTIEFLGRIDHQVKVRGYRVELGEIESVLGSTVGVRRAVVQAFRDDDGSNRLVAFVVLGSPAPDCDTLRTALEARIPGYMVPSAFVALESIPLTPNGKIDRLALIPPKPAEIAAEKAFVPPLSDAERALAALWEQVLGVSPVGATDDFHSLGGQSLKAAVLVSRIETVLGHRIALESLFAAPTVRELARLLQRRLELTGGAAVPLQTTGGRPALFMIAGAGGHVFTFHRFARMLGQDQPTWGMKAYGADGSEPPMDSVPAIAARYADEIAAAKPTGPLVLSGYSVGALIALETALVLGSRGRRVERLIVLDAFAPGHPKQIPYFRRVLLHLRKLWKLSGENRSLYLKQRLSETRKKVLFALNLHRLQAPSITGLDLVPQATLRAVWGGLTKARETYWPSGRFDGPVSLIASNATDQTGDRNKGWGDWTTRKVDLHEVTATHLEMFADHHIDRLAEVFGEILRPKAERDVEVASAASARV